MTRPGGSYVKRRPGTVTLTATKSTRILTRPIMTRPIDETWHIEHLLVIKQEEATDAVTPSDGNVHVEASGAEWLRAKYVHTMLCGEQVAIWDDGETMPEGFDFVLQPDGGQATCQACKLRYAASSSGSLGSG